MVRKPQAQCLKRGINEDMNAPMTSRNETGTLVLQRHTGTPTAPTFIELTVFYF